MNEKKMMRAQISVNLPAWLYHPLKRLRNAINPPANPNLAGDRDIEWSWTVAHMPPGPGEALDFGTWHGSLGLVAAQCGFKVTAIDLEPVRWDYVHPRLRFIEGDLLKLSLPENNFDLVINCSTVEHVGLAGRYGVTQDLPDGDLEAMARLRVLMKPGGVMLMTIPVGQDSVFVPLTRVYGKERLPRLIESFTVKQEEYWIKDSDNRWILADREKALDFRAYAGSLNPLKNSYALGCMVLMKS